MRKVRTEGRLACPFQRATVDDSAEQVASRRRRLVRRGSCVCAVCSGKEGRWTVQWLRMHLTTAINGSVFLLFFGKRCVLCIDARLRVSVRLREHGAAWIYGNQPPHSNVF